MALEGCHVAFVEDVGDEPHLLEDVDVLAIADGHAGRFLPAMLERVEAGVREMGNGLIGCIDAEHPTRFASVHVCILAHDRALAGHVQ
jgi:hypothetical protein